jgi:endoplasmic reticulum-Golgi intermediate compartment protein 3
MIVLCCHVQVVPTEYRYLSKEVLPTNQFSVNEYFVPMKQNDKSWPGTIPSRVKLQLRTLCFILTRFLSPFDGTAVYFLYDLSPITVTIKEERRSFLHFLTRLCAVLGGTFAMTGMNHCVFSSLPFCSFYYT